MLIGEMLGQVQLRSLKDLTEIVCENYLAQGRVQLREFVKIL